MAGVICPLIAMNLSKIGPVPTSLYVMAALHQTVGPMGRPSIISMYDHAF